MKDHKTGRAGKFFAVLAGALLLVFCLKVMTDVVERKDSDMKYKRFFEEKPDFDVLYFGSSHVLNGFFPMDLWREFGITSYNFGGHGNYLPTTYWVMENALDYTTPKVVLIDTFFITPNYKTWYSNTSFVHFSLDAFALSPTKIRAVFDLMNDPQMEADAAAGLIQVAGNGHETRDPIAFLWDFSVYHSRWNELGEEDFQPQPWRTMGAEIKTSVADPNREVYYPDERFDEETLAKEYLRRMIEDCQKRGIEVILTYLPHLADKDNWGQANCVEEIAREYGVEYLNFLYLDEVDYNTDMYDSYAHLNASGAKKVTRYLGNYLRDRYGLGDRHADPSYERWLRDEEDYLRLKGELFTGCTQLRSCLMLLKDRDFDAVIDLKGASALWNDRRYLALLENLGVSSEDLAGKPRFIVIRGGEEATVVHKKDIEGSAQAQTVLGTLRVIRDGGKYRVLLNNKAVLARNDSDRTGSMADVCVLNAWDHDSAADTALYRIYSSKSGKKTLISTAVRDKKL